MTAKRFGVIFVAWVLGSAALSQNRPQSFAAAIAKANALIAIQQPDLPSYHVHYDLRIVHRRGQESSGTFDFIWGGPRSFRLEASTDGYRRLTVRDGTQMWYRDDGGMSLRMMEFDYVRTRPSQDVDAVMTGGRVPAVVSTNLDGITVDCGSAGSGFLLRQVCVQERTGLYASALTDGTSITYDGWMPLGDRFVPTVIRLTRGKKLLLEAHGTVEILDTVSANTFQPPPDAVHVDVSKADENNVPLDEPRETHRVVYREPVPINLLDTGSVFGSVIVKVEVDTKGRVKRAEVVDSDDSALEGPALASAHATIWAPYMINGQAAPFEDTLFFPFRAPRR